MAYKKTKVKTNKKKPSKKLGKRSKLDVNKNGKIDKEDFKLLRSRKKKSKKGVKNGRQK